jgi:ankyrin repeat protein
MLEGGIDVDAPAPKSGRLSRPLVVAISFGRHDEVVELLLEWHADVVNTDISYPRTPLMAAVLVSRARIVELLLACSCEKSTGAMIVEELP